MRSLRSMMHATAVEVLLYLTPAHCSAMLASLAEGMNRQYARFRLRHPDFQARARARMRPKLLIILCLLSRRERQPCPGIGFGPEEVTGMLHSAPCGHSHGYLAGSLLRLSNSTPPTCLCTRHCASAPVQYTADLC